MTKIDQLYEQKINVMFLVRFELYYWNIDAAEFTIWIIHR